MKKTLLTFFTVIVLFLGCEKEGLDGKNSLMDLIIEPAGENCSSGGYKIISGIDINDNGTLDENEIQNTEYICNGDDGYNGNNSLLNVIPEPAGGNCSSGGFKVISGIDLNNNNTLDENEVHNTEYICNGDDGGFDKQVRLTILDMGTSSFGNYGSTTGYLIGDLDRFNKSNWIDVDSIVFVTNIRTTNASHTAYAELYDVTNKQIIENSTVSTNKTSTVKIESSNIYNSLPNAEINLAIQLRIENSSSTTYISGKSYLLLYRTE